MTIDALKLLRERHASRTSAEVAGVPGATVTSSSFAPLAGAATDSGAGVGIAAILTFLTVFSLVPVWSTPILPLQDLPNHLVKVDILHRFLEGDAAVWATYAPNLRPFANYICYVVIFLLAPLIGLMPAAKVFVSAYLLALPVAGYSWLRTTNPRNLLLALAVPALGYNLYLTKGNLNFCAALPIYLFSLVAFIRSSGRPTPSLAFTALATLLYFTHGFVFLALGFTVGCLVLAKPDRSAFGRALGLVPGLLLFVISSVWTVLASDTTRAFQPAFAAIGARQALSDAFLWLFGGRGHGYDLYFAAAWSIAIAAIIAITVASVLRECKANPRTLVRRHPIFVASIGLGLLYLAAPANLTDWGHLRVRFIPITCLTLLGALRLPSSRTARAAAAAVFVVAALAIQLRTVETYGQASAEVEEYVDGIAAVHPDASILPIYAPTGETVRYNLHSWGYYEIARGGWSPYLQAYPAYHPVVYRQVPWAPPEDIGGNAIDGETLRRAAACYDYVLVWKPTAEQAETVDRYFEPIYQSAHLRIWQNRHPLWQGPPAANPACFGAGVKEHHEHA